MTPRKKRCMYGDGKPVKARGMCGLHLQRAKDGVDMDAPIRERARASDGREALSGARVLPDTLAAVERAAKAAGLARNRVIAHILDGWADGRVWTWRRARFGGLLAGFSAMAAAVVLCCVPPPVRPTEDPVVTGKAIPDRPMPGQVRPPCPRGSREIKGGCYNLVTEPDARGNLVPMRCDVADEVYFSHDGLCYIDTKVKPKQPRAVEP